jgi:transposase-like protein
MEKDNVLSLKKHHQTIVDDPLTELLREGARTLLAQAVEQELAAFLDAHRHLRDAQGRSRIVRNGYLPEREVQTGIGAVEVKVPRVHDRGQEGLRFHSKLLPPYLRKSRSLEALILWWNCPGIVDTSESSILKQTRIHNGNEKRIHKRV